MLADDADRPNGTEHDTEEPVTKDWLHRDAIVNGVRLHYVEAGDGPLVLLLHGFPEFWYSWRRQIPALAGAGFRVLAPDMRGFNTSAKPSSVGAYRIEVLAADVVGLIHHVGAERAVVVGHDWGGMVGWFLGMHQPEVLDRLVILNAPHPAAIRREIRSLDQWRRSSYVFAFQLPRLPETLFRAGRYAVMRRALRREPLHPDAFASADIGRYVEAMDQPGALTATINYYRAAFRHLPFRTLGSVRPVTTPTLIIWGDQDRYLAVRLTDGLEGWVPNLRVEHLPDASHWVQNDSPDQVNALLLAFLSET